MTSKKDKNKTKKKDTPEEENQEPVEILTPKHNLLKNKAGARINPNDPGFIEEDKIAAADKIIANLCKDSAQTLDKQIGLLTRLWDKIQEMPDDEARKKKTDDIFTIAHEIKDVAALCGYPLIAHFAESLRDYIAETTMNLKNQRIIIQAHIDALKTVLKTGINDEKHPVATELMDKVKIAIEKYR